MAVAEVDARSTRRRPYRIVGDDGRPVSLFDQATDLVRKVPGGRRLVAGIDARAAIEQQAGRPTARERRSLMRMFRQDFPTFNEAVSADLRIFCASRGERFDHATTAEKIKHAARVAVDSDAFFAMLCYRAKASLQARGVPIVPRLLHRTAMAVGQVCIGDPVVIEPGVYLPHGQVVIDGIVRIRSNVTIRPWVTIGLKEGVVQGATIDRGVRIGTGAKVIGPVTLGRGAVVGANAVVVHDVGPNVTVVGAPARPMPQ
jgi:serine O-acetyltransferase